MEQEDYKKAKQELQLIINNSNRTVFIDIASIRLARILIFEKNYKLARELLNNIKQKTLRFAAAKLKNVIIDNKY